MGKLPAFLYSGNILGNLAFQIPNISISGRKYSENIIKRVLEVKKSVVEIQYVYGLIWRCKAWSYCTDCNDNATVWVFLDNGKV